MQTLNQFLQSIAGSSNKQTALHSTLESQNIAGLYKQQQTDDQFKVGSPSGSVYWTAGAPLSLLGVLQCHMQCPTAPCCATSSGDTEHTCGSAAQPDRGPSACFSDRGCTLQPEGDRTFCTQGSRRCRPAHRR